MPVPSPLSDLTTRQQEVYDFVVSYWLSRGFPPTIRDVCEEFGISSPNGVSCHFRALIQKGLLRRLRISHQGAVRTVYAPIRPVVDVERDARAGVVRLATAGGPVFFGQVQWVAWLREQLAAAEGGAA